MFSHKQSVPLVDPSRVHASGSPPQSHGTDVWDLHFTWVGYYPGTNLATIIAATKSQRLDRLEDIWNRATYRPGPSRLICGLEFNNSACGAVESVGESQLQRPHLHLEIMWVCSCHRPG